MVKKKVAKHAIGLLESFFPNSIIERIVQHTNSYLTKFRKNYSRPRDVRPTDMVEIKALFELLYMTDVKKTQHLNVKYLWTSDESGVECMRSTMSRKKFLLLLRALRFDNFEDRAEQKLHDTFAAVTDVLDEFISKCKENYQVGEYSTVDEMLEPFGGCYKFRQYIPSKPAK
ncbi:hypothetical protein ILUMI_11000 [Ignelater luminosus]|uniref:PiggyBac transposable element-derived protein domain-containing protein n=1 Tax=Ignelater luminosus TaxID=2038154 RepID=A0A8K0D1B0_IGNLU|nr:hypothetical protein ILUMI_11000 [Ignelater luminosus]